MRLHSGLGAGFLLALALAAPGACSGSSGSGGGADASAEVAGDDAGEPVICTEFTAAGAACPTASPVRCFAECEAGGCSCTSTAQGPRWVCVTDRSCLPDCAPLDDGCASGPTGDDGRGGDDSGGGGEDATDAQGADTGAGDTGSPVEAGDAGDASG